MKKVDVREDTHMETPLNDVLDKLFRAMHADICRLQYLLRYREGRRTLINGMTDLTDQKGGCKKRWM